MGKKMLVHGNGGQGFMAPTFVAAAHAPQQRPDVLGKNRFVVIRTCGEEPLKSLLQW